MLAEYTIKMTLDNGDSFNLGMIAGGVLVICTYLFVDWYMNK